LASYLIGLLLGCMFRCAISSVLRVLENRTEKTEVVRFPRIRNQTGTEFFGFDSRFFRFGSRFPVLFAQGQVSTVISLDMHEKMPTNWREKSSIVTSCTMYINDNLIPMT
jgi:hypothetical protein